MTRRTPPPSDEKLLDPETEAQLLDALRAAFRPEDLSEARHAELVANALDDAFAPPSAEELVESERLRRALEGEAVHPDLALVHALRAAAGATGDSSLPEAASLRALQEQRGSGRKRAETPNRVYVFFGAAGAITALAAAAVLWLRTPHETAAESARGLVEEPELAVARSTQELFASKFETATTSLRMDRIASVRARELRENRYALWGVK